MSYANMILYSTVIPSYKGEKKNESEQEIIQAEDPANRDAVRKFFEQSD